MISSIDILLLGLVKEEKMSAYDLQKVIQMRNIKFWVQISKASIYKKMISFEKKGYVSSEVIKNGNMPEKTIYSITEKGDEFFFRGINELSKEALRFFLGYNVVLMNINKFEEDMQKKIIENIEYQIKDFNDGVKKNAPQKALIPVFGDAIIKQQLMLSNTMVSWIEDFKEKYFREIEK